MTVRIYAALTIAVACSLAACSTAPSGSGVSSSSQVSVSEIDPIPGLEKSELGASTAASADATGSIPTEASPKTGGSGDVIATWPDIPRSQSSGRASREPRLDGSKTATRKLDEPLYRSPETQILSDKATNVAMAPAHGGATPGSDVAAPSTQSISNQSGSISLNYSSEAVDLSEKDRRNAIGFVVRRSSNEPIVVVTGPSAAASPLEGLLRVQERGRRLSELLGAHGPVEIRFEPNLPRDSVRID